MEQNTAATGTTTGSRPRLSAGLMSARKSKSPVGLSSNWPRDFRWTEVASVNQSGKYGRSSERIFWTSLHRTLRFD